MPELTRDALFEALRNAKTLRHDRRRVFLSTCMQRSNGQWLGFSEDPQTRAGRGIFHACSGAWATSFDQAALPMRMSVEVIGTAPIERVEVLHGTQVAQTMQPYCDQISSRRVRVLWQGAEYRGRGRETHLAGKIGG